MLDLTDGLSPHLIVTDVDGTLLNVYKRVSRATRDAFARAVASGRQIALISSRMPASLSAVEAELGVPCWKLAYDGALLVEPGASGSVIQVARGIDRLEVAGIVAMINAAYVGVYAGDDWFCEAEGRWSDREAHNTGVRPREVSDLRAATEAISLNKSIFKIMVRDEAGAVASAKEALAGLGLSSARWFSNSDTILEIVSAGADKSKGLRALLGRLALDLSRVVAFGDGYNDLPVFEMVENGVAVANAIPQLKELARHVTGRGDADGVADYLDRLLLYEGPCARSDPG